MDERRRTYKVKIAEAIGAAFGTFSRIPVPKSAWTDFGSTHALAAFPLVGLAEGFLMTAWGHVANLLGVPATIVAACGGDGRHPPRRALRHL